MKKNQISYDQPITSYLDKKVTKGLHVYKEKEYTHQIQIKHLLNHTSGLGDGFWELLDHLTNGDILVESPLQAVMWCKENISPVAKPGQKFFYSDTNYYLLGLIIEKITQKRFQDALKEHLFEPLDLKDSYFIGDKPKEKSWPMADFYRNQNKIKDHKHYAALDYAGGGVVASMEDCITFMDALVHDEILEKSTLDIMKENQVPFGGGISYGYGIMEFRSIPLIMPKDYQVWGHAGATGSFLFYNPSTDTLMSGCFNDFSYEKKAIRFMFQIIKQIKKATFA